MIRRTLEPILRREAAYYPCVLVMGPRQSGKTTLCRATFPDLPYVSLESPDERTLATRDPKEFLKRFPDGAILDEVQRAPHLLSWIQGIVDAPPHRNGRFILTGSHNLMLLKSVSQSLAGRVALRTLLPFSLEELAASGTVGLDLWSVVHSGGYPRVRADGIPVDSWFGSYFATYVERDVREVLPIQEVASFETFVRLCAGRSAQLANLSSLGGDAGVSQPTIRSWITALQISYLAWRLPPWHSNPTKQLVRTPKVHLLDTGFICWLLGIRTPHDLSLHPLRGAIFESFVFSELLKARVHRGLPPDLWFLRNRKGREIDLVIADAMNAHAIEVKSTHTIFVEPLVAISEIEESLRTDIARTITRTLVYAGDTTQERSLGMIRSWRDLAQPTWATASGS